ncbi:hypothetical protein [Pseudodesulfovibrio piezophilus]|uniref:Lipoprotein n=1 Tax=Pseudodesulfovibrio piezophilus (strain DSM 21447 / JCM 15486 / C1TLV30) TaxID=1322246 RepID=M1WVR4_PSEP2|nr:hypothetical protein [Pseudodesulfovibrio piezophilus]CCH48693.1 conserved exported protein of unknown function [Pseudodesulfovibrio piezophilus C1TLV30]
MKKRLVSIVAIGILLQAGCSLTQVEHKESTIPFGSSVRMAVKQQIFNPEAGGDAPVVGLNGRYAASVAKKYDAGPKTEAASGPSVSETIIGTK